MNLRIFKGTIQVSTGSTLIKQQAEMTHALRESKNQALIHKKTLSIMITRLCNLLDIR